MQCRSTTRAGPQSARHPTLLCNPIASGTSFQTSGARLSARKTCNSSGLKNCTFYEQKGAHHSFESWFPTQWDYKEALDAWLIGDRRGLWNDIAFSRPDGRPL